MISSTSELAVSVYLVFRVCRITMKWTLLILMLLAVLIQLTSGLPKIEDNEEYDDETDINTKTVAPSVDNGERNCL